MYFLQRFGGVRRWKRNEAKFREFITSKLIVVRAD